MRVGGAPVGWMVCLGLATSMELPYFYAWTEDGIGESSYRFQHRIRIRWITGSDLDTARTHLCQPIVWGTRIIPGRICTYGRTQAQRVSWTVTAQGSQQSRLIASTLPSPSRGARHPGPLLAGLRYSYNAKHAIPILPPCTHVSSMLAVLFIPRSRFSVPKLRIAPGFVAVPV